MKLTPFASGILPSNVLINDSLTFFFPEKPGKPNCSKPGKPKAPQGPKKGIKMFFIYSL